MRSNPGRSQEGHGVIDRLTVEDRVMLDMSRRWPQDIGALLVLDGSALFDDHGALRLEALRAAVGARLGAVPRLRQVIRYPGWGRGGPYWQDAPAVDLARHIRELRLEPPAGEAALLRTVEELRAVRLDPRRPLWELRFLTGLPDRRVALFVKIHHSIGDGLAAMTIVSALLDAPGGAQLAPVPWSPAPEPRPSDLVADELRRRVAGLAWLATAMLHPVRTVAGLLAAAPAMREILAERPGDPTSIDRVVGDGRTFALVRGDYRTLRGIARAADASVNDVLLAVTTAGLRTLLVARGEPVEDVTLRAYVPVTLRRRLRGPQQGTQIAQMVVPLSLGDASPMQRLRSLAADTRRRKALPRPSVGAAFRGRLARRLLLKMVIAQRVNVATASIPGPRRPRSLAGARVLEVVPLLPLVGNQPLGIGLVTYADTVGIGISADRDALPDLEILAAGVRAELAALTDSVRAEPQMRPVASAPGG
jgi:diacylglycerol O-acyltransferase